MDRQGFLGGSDIAAVLGISPWMTPYALWEQKVWGFEDVRDSQSENVLRWGKRLEPVVMEALQEEHDLCIGKRNGIFIDAEYDFFRAEIDFRWTDEYGFEQNGDVKTVSPYMREGWGDAGTGDVPTYYIAQFQWGMSITGAMRCLVAALFGANDLRLYMVERDEQIIAFLRDRALGFWRDNVLAKVAPALKDASDAEKMLNKFDGVTVTVTDELRATAKRLCGVKAAQKRLEMKREEYENTLKFAIALRVDGAEQTPGNTAIVDASGKPLLTWNAQRCRRLNAKRVQELHPAIAEQCTEETEIRVLRLKEKAI